jgi:Zn-dependent protease/CBS domain-containing protein
MRWSWKLGRFAGIDVFVHATFLLLIGWVALSYWLQQGSLAAALSGVLFILALFLCVVLHEFGHALMARRFGIQTRDITLLPIGGVARLERMPDDPKQELWVALAGPAVNVVIVAVLFGLLAILGRPALFGSLSLTEGSFLERLMLVNVSLVVFNLIPAFPMDGGRVLRALLAMRLEYTQATQVAAALGQGLAFVFGFIGLFTNPFLLFIAFFVWIGAAQESSMVQMRSALDGIPVNRAMLTEFHTLTPDDTLKHVTDLILSGWQHDFPVTEDSRVVGVLTRDQLMKALSQHGPETPVRQVMWHEFQEVDASEMLKTALTRAQSCGCHTLPVTRNGQLVGLLTMENLGEFLMIQSALSGGRGRRLLLS